VSERRDISGQSIRQGLPKLGGFYRIPFPAGVMRREKWSFQKTEKYRSIRQNGFGMLWAGPASYLPIERD
jgi:hypothetical protein